MATQKVLSTPELVSEILSFDAAGYREDHWAYDQTFFKNNFARYARVNFVWFHEAMRYLWWTPSPFDKLSVLAGLPGHRKQVYVQFMVKLSFRNDPGPWGGSRGENVILQGLHLSNLRFARIQISTGQKLLSLPVITSDVLRDLTIDVVQFNTGKGGALSDNSLRKRFAKRLKVGPSCGRLVRSTWVEIACLEKMFPSLEKITINVPAPSALDQGDLASFQAQLPGIEWVVNITNG